MMRNFSFLLPEVLVGSTPFAAEHIEALEESYNVGVVITLTEETPLESVWFGGVGGGGGGAGGMKGNTKNGTSKSGGNSAKSERSHCYQDLLNAERVKIDNGEERLITQYELMIKQQEKNAKVDVNRIRNLFVPTPNYHPMNDIETADAIVREVWVTAFLQGKRAFIHCGGGKGRAGTAAACCLLKFGCLGVLPENGSSSVDEGRSGDLRSPGPQLGSDEAIRYLRLRRPGSLETDRQEKFVRTYAEDLWRKADSGVDAILVGDNDKAREKEKLDEKKDEKKNKQPIVEVKAANSNKTNKAANSNKAPNKGPKEAWGTTSSTSGSKKETLLPRTKSSEKRVEQEQERAELTDIIHGLIRTESGGKNKKTDRKTSNKSGTQSKGETPTATTTGKFPSIPYLPFSPSIAAGDEVANTTANTTSSSSTSFSNNNANGTTNEIIITEKLDGGNCCIKNNQVFARTHAHPATHPSFAPVKALVENELKWNIETYQNIVEKRGLELYGENMTAQHSIEYVLPRGKWKVDGVINDKDHAVLTSYFYLFAVRDPQADNGVGRWLSWDEVVEISQGLNLPVVPVCYRGPNLSDSELKRKLDNLIKFPSGLHRNLSGDGVERDVLARMDLQYLVRPEGFVVRSANGFDSDELGLNCRKYVRSNHLQTEDNWKKTWTKNMVVEGVGRFVYEADERVGVNISDSRDDISTSTGSTRARGTDPKSTDLKNISSSSKTRDVSEKRKENEMKNSFKKPAFDLVILTGLPGSGKSTFTGPLKGHPYCEILDSDQMSKNELESAVGQIFKQNKNGNGGKEKDGNNNKGKTIIVDRVNATRNDRLALAKLCFSQAKILVVEFGMFTPEECSDNLRKRCGHPTIGFGKSEESTKKIVQSFVKQWESVDLKKEGVAGSNGLGKDCILEKVVERGDVGKVLGKWFGVRAGGFDGGGGDGGGQQEVAFSVDVLKSAAVCLGSSSSTFVGTNRNGRIPENIPLKQLVSNILGIPLEKISKVMIIPTSELAFCIGVANHKVGEKTENSSKSNNLPGLTHCIKDAWSECSGVFTSVDKLEKELGLSSSSNDLNNTLHSLGVIYEGGSGTKTFPGEANVDPVFLEKQLLELDGHELKLSSKISLWTEMEFQIRVVDELVPEIVWDTRSTNTNAQDGTKDSQDCDWSGLKQFCEYVEAVVGGDL